jgi:predicted DNA-binding transcriptional regulator AlpA
MMPLDTIGAFMDASTKVMSWSQWLAKNNLSQTTGWRLRKNGQGPRIVKLSERRLGVTAEDDAAWLASRTVANP